MAGLLASLGQGGVPTAALGRLLILDVGASHPPNPPSTILLRLELEAQGKAKRSGPEHLVVRRYRCPPVHCVNCPLAQVCAQKPASGRTVSRSEYEEEVEALRARMGTEEAQGLYKLRRQRVELVNADWKAHRKLRCFSGRGLERARCQVGLIVLVHNLLTLHAEEKKAKAAAAAAASPADIAT